jgi:serine/threonine protein kinase/pimeloyl-ACP methyl ester carboxylesterase/DNA-binding winged helix-turn-helix (wHTH) protein/class 3 adenylate cyclase
MAKQARHVYEFPPFRLDPVERILWKNGGPVALTPKAFDTLVVLVENNRHVMTKEELLELIWPDTYVEETNLAQHISMLRRVLGEKPDGGQFIETVPKRGYRFVSTVRQLKLEPTRASLLQAEQIGKKAEAAQRETIPPPVREDAQRITTINPGMQLGRYEILSRVGVGGMGEVYLANDTQLERRVALKLLSSEYTDNQQWLRRFNHEAKAASALNHPNILTIHEIGQTGGRHYIATEYIEGQTLRQQMACLPVGKSMKLSQALNIAIQIASALSAAHAAGIVHRDIKPENVMVRPDGYIKVLDFGLAKQIRRGLGRLGDASTSVPTISNLVTDPGTVMGTVTYMSPEQARGLDVDGRSDVFSLGILLYELVAGHPPFEGPTPSDVMVAILDHEPPRLSRTLDNVPPELERIVGRSLRKDREERYQTIKDFQLDLKNLLQELELKVKLGDAWAEANGAIGTPSQARSAKEQASQETELPLPIPEIHYARSGDVNIAYQVIGTGPIDLVFVMGWVSHLEWFWKEPSFAHFLQRLASFARVILFDKRGTGLSDRVPLNELPTLEQRMDDVRAVMEAAGSEKAVLCGVSEGGPLCSLFAATYPEKTTALVMIGSYARRLWADDYPWGPTEEQREHFFEEIRRDWGGPVGIEARAPTCADDPQFRNWWATYLRMGASPGAALTLTKMNAEIDIRPILPTIQVPTLVIHRTDELCLRVEEGRYLAENIPGAKFVELPGVDHLPFVGDQDGILDEVEEFLTGVRHATEVDRVLATVLVARAIGSAAETDRLNDTRWRELLDRHQAHVKREIELFKGRAVEVVGDKVIATFDGPARAIRAAAAITDSARRLGLKLQTGLHTGECDVLGDKVGGVAVELAAQVATQAAVNEVLVSSTVKDLVAGSGIRFGERGAAVLGPLGEWRLFAVER